MRSRLDDRDRADIERLAADKLADPGDLWLSSSIDAMRGEDGALDVAKASQEIETLLKAKPHWAKPGRVDLHQGVRQTADRQEPPSFGEALRSQRGE